MSKKINLKICTFSMGTDKEAAVKVIEEAAEAYAAWQEIKGCASPEQCVACEVRDRCSSPVDLADEIADCIQVCCNLAARYGIDLQAAMNECHKRNHERGRC